MSLFLETIKINNGRRINLDGHNERLNWTRNRHFHEIRDIDLKEEIKVPSEYRNGIVKCRVVYGRQIEKIEFEKYVFSNPRSFKIVNGDFVDYSFKNADRTLLQGLFTHRTTCDDIIILKNGRLTDSYYANLALLKSGCWYTPASPLLNGTQRRKLIAKGRLMEIDITLGSIFQFEAIRIFNAMTEWNMHIPVSISGDSILA